MVNLHLVITSTLCWQVSEAVDLVISGMSFRQLMGKTFIPFFEYLPTSENRRIKTAKEIADNTVLDVSI